MNKLRNEVDFVGSLAQLCFGRFPEDQRKKLEDIFCLRSDELVTNFNRWIEKTIDELKKGSISVEGFSFQHEECLSALLDSDKPDGELRKEFKKLLEKKCEEEAHIRKKHSEMFEREAKIKAILSSS